MAVIGIAEVCYSQYRVGQKTDCFSELITLRWLVVEMRVICQNLANFI